MSAQQTRYKFEKINQANDLFGYRFDPTLLHSLQLQIKQDYSLTDEGRTNVREQLGKKFQKQYLSAMALLSAQCACATCGDRPLVEGSRHELLPGKTLKLFKELEEHIRTIEGQLVTVPDWVIIDLKEMFEGVVASYKKEKVSAACTAAFPAIAQAGGASSKDSGVGSKSGASKKTRVSDEADDLEME